MARAPRDEPRPAPPGDGLVSRPLARLAALKAGLPSQEHVELAAAAPLKAGSPLAKALAGRLVISRDSRGRGGKTVTWVRGIAGAPALLEELARELRHELGCGVRVEDGALVAQGALGERLAASLARRGAARIVMGN